MSASIGKLIIEQELDAQANSNIVLTFQVTPLQYSNLMFHAANQGLTIEQFLNRTNTDIIRDIREKALRERVNNALNKFRTLTDEQKEQVLVLIESF